MHGEEAGMEAGWPAHPAEGRPRRSPTPIAAPHRTSPTIRPTKALGEVPVRASLNRLRWVAQTLEDGLQRGPAALAALGMPIPRVYLAHEANGRTSRGAAWQTAAAPGAGCGLTSVCAEQQ